MTPSFPHRVPPPFHSPSHAAQIRPSLFRIAAAAIVLIASALFVGAAHARQPEGGEVTLEIKPLREKVAPGDQIPIAVIFDHQPGWHIQSNAPVVPPELEGFEPIKTAIAAEVAAGIELFPTQWPQVHKAAVNFTGAEVKIDVFEGRAIAYVPVRVASDAVPGATLTLPLTVTYQACDDKACVAPETIRRSVRFVVVAAEDLPASSGADPDFAAFDGRVFAGPPAGGDGGAESPSASGGPAAEAIPIDFFGYRFTVGPWMIWVIAFLAGLILNFTPCVLPVIPIKVLSIQAHAKDPAKLALFGTLYCLGIVAFFGVLAVLVGFFGQAWGQLNGYWWFSVPLALIVAAMGLSMLGLFALRVPQSVYYLNPSGDSAGGNFMLGILTAILSTPCTGPMLAAVMAWGATQAPAVGVVAVLVMGIGMAFPYALLIFFPGLVDRLPRSGPGGELMKQVLGIFMLAVAVYVLSFLTPEIWTWWFVGLFAAAGFVWMYIGALRVVQGINAKLLVTHGAILGLILTLMATRAMTQESVPGGGGAGGVQTAGAIPWRVFKSESDGSIGEAVDQGLGAGKVVVVVFTAKWCGICQVIDKTILNSDVGREQLNRRDVVAIKVDLSWAGYTEGWAILKEFSGAASIPFLAVSGSERPRSNPITFASLYKPSDLKEAIQAVNGGRTAEGAGGTGGAEEAGIAAHR